MKTNRIKWIGIGILSMVLLSGFAWAAENTQATGNLAMPLMWEGGTARAMAMGSAVVAVPQGSASLLWNPAGLGQMSDCMELGLHHNSGLGDTIQETVVVGMPMGALGGFAAALNYVNNGTFDGRDSVGVKTSDYTAGDMGVILGWGKQLFSHISVGAAVKYNKQTLADTSYSAYAADMGLLWNPRPRLNLGVTYVNLGTKVADSTLDSGCRVGASYGVNDNLLFAASGELKSGNGFDRLELGVEDWFHPMVALRLGYVHDVTDQQVEDFNLSGLTAGIGIKIVKNLMFDYAYVPAGDLGISQRVSLTYKFVCKKKIDKPAPVAEAIPEPVAVIVPNVIIVKNVKLIVLEDAHFAFNSAALTESGEKIVTENIQILKDNPETSIRVAGYTSCSGTAEYNQKLSERRAEAVEAIMIKKGGIAPERITTIGYGAARPAEHEQVCELIDSKAAHANMRVLFEIILKQDQTKTP